MSALTKPANHFTGTTQAQEPVINAEHVSSVETRDIPAQTGVAASYEILFFVINRIDPVVVKYDTDTKRDFALAAWKTANSAAIASA